MKRKWIITIFLILLLLSAMTTSAAEQYFPTDVAVASEGCTLLGLEGKFIVQTQAALDRINEIRLEACREGVPHPSTLQPMTMDDYIPIKWSADLEYIAKIRAAEASLTMDHVRTNGKSCFAISSPNGVRSYGEVIAWNWTESVVYGIEQWYDEKADWVNQNENAVTGHYTQMIDPGHTYVGIGTFCSEDAKYYNSTAGQFSFESYLPESTGNTVQHGIQILEINNSNLSGDIQVTGMRQGKKGDQCPLALSATVSFTDYWYGQVTTSGLHFLDNVTWKSANAHIASVSSDGVVVPNHCGEVQITGTLDNGKSAVTAFTVDHTKVKDPEVAATCKSTGLTKGSHCAVCNLVFKEQKRTEKISHTWDAGIVTKEATVFAAGKKTLSCTMCGKTKEKSIPKVKIRKGDIFSATGFSFVITDAKTNGKGKVSLTGVKGAKNELIKIQIPAAVRYGGVSFRIVSIGTKAFKGCKNLKEVIVGNNVVSIGKEAFYNCKSLRKVKLGTGVTKISDRAFMKCAVLKKIIIKSKNLKTVGKNAVRSIDTKVKIKVPGTRVKTYRKIFGSKTGFTKTMKLTK